MFSIAYRTNDGDIFILALIEMCPIIFAGYQPNYARWMVNMENGHRGIRHILQNGALSVKISSRSFSRTPVYITLEHVVNAKAASRLTGVATFGRPESAKRRWIIKRSVESATVGHLLTTCRLKSTDDI